MMTVAHEDEERKAYTEPLLCHKDPRGLSDDFHGLHNVRRGGEKHGCENYLQLRDTTACCMTRVHPYLLSREICSQYTFK